MNTTLLPGRTYYQCSGRVDWGRFLPWLALLLLGSAVMAVLLTVLFFVGYYLILIVPLLAALAVAGLARLAVGKGHCRSAWLAAAAGCLAGIVLYFGYFYAGMVYTLGPEVAGQLNLLPAYIKYRMATQVTRDIHDSRKDREVSPPRSGGIVLNWFLFAGETALVLGLTSVGAFRRARKPYCETCQCWLSRDLTQFEPSKDVELLRALETSSPRALASLCSTPTFTTLPNTTLALETCPSLKDGRSRDCPAFVSLKNITTAPNGAVLDPFETSKGKLLVRAVQLESSELPALAPRFSFLEPLVGRSAVAALVSSDAEKSEADADVASAEVRPVEANFAGKVLTRKTAWIGLAYTLFTMLLALGGLFAVLGGAMLAFPDAPAPRPSAERKAAGISIMCASSALALTGIILALTNPSYFGNRRLRRLARREFARRTGCFVSPEDPDALFVEVVPKLNWAKMTLENASDIGFLLVDRPRRQLLFEGDRERWRVPAAAITFCAVEEFVHGKGTAGALRIYFTVLRANRPNQFWEAPIRERGATGKFLAHKRKKRALKLTAAIQEMTGPARPAGSVGARPGQ